MQQAINFKGHKRGKNAKGFTLVELLVATAIVGTLLIFSGYGLTVILGANDKAEAETERRAELNRGLDYISEDIRAANSITTSAPTWAWAADLGGGNPQAKLFLQIPLPISSIDPTNSRININGHGFNDKNAVMFTGSTINGLTNNVVYYVLNAQPNSFQLTQDIRDTTALPLTSASSSSYNSFANRLVVYYIRDNTSTWLGPKTINRSVGRCVDNLKTPSVSVPSNCFALLDSITDNGFLATVSNSKVVNVTLQSQACIFNSQNNTCNSPRLYKASTQAFPRLN